MGRPWDDDRSKIISGSRREARNGGDPRAPPTTKPARHSEQGVFAAVAGPCRLQADQVVGVKEFASEIGRHSVVRGGLASVQGDRVFPLGSHIRDIENGGDLLFRSAESSLV